MFHGYVRAISPSSPRQTGLDHLLETDLCSHKVIPWRLGQPPDYPAAPNLGLRPDHPADPNLDRVRTIIGSPRGTMPKPSSIYSATPNLTRTRTLLRRLTWVPPPRSHCEETENKKSARIATFLRLAIVMGSSDRGSRCKSAGNRLFSSVFPL